MITFSRTSGMSLKPINKIRKMRLRAKDLALRISAT